MSESPSAIITYTHHDDLRLIGPNMDDSASFLQELDDQSIILGDIVNLGDETSVANSTIDGYVLLESRG